MQEGTDRPAASGGCGLAVAGCGWGMGALGSDQVVMAVGALLGTALTLDEIFFGLVLDDVTMGVFVLGSEFVF